MTAVTDFTDTHLNVSGPVELVSETVDIEAEVFVGQTGDGESYLAISGGNAQIDEIEVVTELSPEQALAVADALVQAATADVDGGQS